LTVIAENRSAISIRLRILAVAAGLGCATMAVAGQLLSFGVENLTETRAASAEPISQTYSRPDIIDRDGRIIATDVAANSLFADRQWFSIAMRLRRSWRALCPAST
jgi:hypothetical protein